MLGWHEGMRLEPLPKSSSARLHRAGVEIFSAMYGRDFFAENELLNALAIDTMTLDDLKTLCREGYASQTQPA